LYLIGLEDRIVISIVSCCTTYGNVLVCATAMYCVYAVQQIKIELNYHFIFNFLMI